MFKECEYVVLFDVFVVIVIVYEEVVCIVVDV